MTEVQTEPRKRRGAGAIKEKLLKAEAENARLSEQLAQFADEAADLQLKLQSLKLREDENRQLRERLEALEAKVESAPANGATATGVLTLEPQFRIAASVRPGELHEEPGKPPRMLPDRKVGVYAYPPNVAARIAVGTRCVGMKGNKAQYGVIDAVGLESGHITVLFNAGPEDPREKFQESFS